MIVVDAHEDLAWNIQTFGRDYLLPVADTRQRESGSSTIARNGNTLIGWPEWIRGNVAVVFATLFVAPASSRMGAWENNCYGNADEAHQLYSSQLDLYHQLAEANPDKLQLIRQGSDLEAVLATWESGDPSGRRVGLVILMEGAEGVREPAEVAHWYERGVRMIGPAWTRTRYAGGTGDPGPFTEAGRALLAEMGKRGMVLDLSHLSEEGTAEALAAYEGPLMASHCNPRALLPTSRNPERHLSDAAIRGVAARDGVIGVVLGNQFLKDGWLPAHGRAGVTLADVAAHIDYHCQIIGDAWHVGVGSDFDGGIGLEKTPSDFDTVADLARIGEALDTRGYSAQQVEAILGGNWLRFLRRTLPA